jgi:predicted trehalose synthase
MRSKYFDLKYRTYLAPNRPDWLRIPLKGVLYVMEAYHDGKH